MTIRVPIAQPWFDEAEREAVIEPLDDGWVVQGPRVAKFEELVREYTGSKAVAACTSGTTALHLCTRALELSEGDEVIVPSFTWISTANSVAYTGARPVLVDVELDTFNVDPKTIEAAITPKTKAIMIVHLFGRAAHLSAIMEIATAHGLAVIEDAACALGTFYHDQHVGTFGDLGIFSFHPRKIITTGEGGMVLTQSTDMYKTICSLRNHGASQIPKSTAADAPSYLLGDFDQLGFNYRMPDILGAIGVAQMNKLPQMLAERRRLAQRYDEALSELDWLKRPDAPKESTHSYQSYVCLFAPQIPTVSNWESLSEHRNRCMNILADAGISTRQGTHAVHGLSVYRDTFGYRFDDHPNSWFAEHLSIALPIFPGMTDAQQNHVVDILKRCI